MSLMRIPSCFSPLLAGLLLLCALPVLAAAPWALPGWKYRVPVQVYNAGDTPLATPVIALTELPFTLLISAGKLAEDGRDLRLLDETGTPVRLRAEHLLSDTGDARLLFSLPELKARERRLFTLYYGGERHGDNAAAMPGAPTAVNELKIGTGAEESAAPVPSATVPTLEQWLARHTFVEAETHQGTGFTAQPVGAELAPVTSGEVLMAAGGARDTVTFTTEVEAGAYTCWVRCLPADPPGGTLTLAVEQNGKVLAAPVDPLAGVATRTFRWFPLRATAAKGPLQVIARANGSRAALDGLVLTRDVNYRPDYRDFQGRVWARWRIDQPGYRYWAKIHNDWNPYQAIYKFSGIVTSSGLLPEVGGPHEAIPFPTTDADFMTAGEYSSWVPLPASTAKEWHSVFFFPPKPGMALPDDLTARLEFANRPSPDRIFHITPAEPLELRTATCGVRMPTETTLESLSQLETFTEWAQRRYTMVKKLNLSPPPRLTKLRVGTWDSLNTRLGGGLVPKVRAKIDFEELEALGINMGMINGVDDAALGELANEHGITTATFTAWAEMWRYSVGGYAGEYAYKGNETPPQRWQRVFDDYYGKLIADAKINSPNLMALARRINLGDEIGQVTNAKEIAETPQLLEYFREWLKARGVTPADFGAASWDAVQPLDDRKVMGGDQGAKAKNFYWTWQFINDYSTMFYRTATEAFQKYAGPREMMVNYQGGPMQIAYLGNDNDMANCPMDLFHMNREQAFNTALTEDWVYGWDMGIGRINLGNEMMRCAARKHNQPIANYLIGGEAIRAKFIANLMLGVKDIDLYIYGPISNAGPAWAENEKALKETAEVTRLVKTFENEIAAGAVRPRKAALLIAFTSDLMQKKDLYFLAERQAFYLALDHDNLPVDVICEQEIEQDNILKNYSLLYVIDPNVRDAAQRKIAEWVKAGGTLWACAGAAEWNEYNQPSTILNEAFGVKSRAMVTQQNWLTWASAFYGWQPIKFAYEQLGTLTADHPLAGGKLSLPVWGAKLDAAPATAQVLGTYADGKPALLHNTCGKGQALLVGALVGEAYVRQHYVGDLKTCGRQGWSFDSGAEPRRLATALAAPAKVVRPVTLSVPGIYASVMDSPQGSILFLNNATLAAETDLANAQVPTLTVQVRDAARVKAVESATAGALKFTQKDGVVTFQVTLPHVAVILLRH